MFHLYPFFHLLIALIEWGLIGWAVFVWRQSNSVAMIVLPILLASTSYDNLVLALGSFFGEGELLKALSMARFLLHYVVVPLFIVVGVELAHRAGASWATKLTRILSWLIAFGLATIDVITKYRGIELAPVEFAGVLRYSIAQPSGPPIITIIVNFFVLAIGIGIWIRLEWPWLFVGSLLGIVGNAIPIAFVGTLAGSTSEFILAISLLLTEQRTQFFPVHQLSESK